MHPVGKEDSLSFVLKSEATGRYLTVGENFTVNANQEIGKYNNINRTERYVR